MAQSEETIHRRQKALQCWYLTGATASGKTSVAMELAAQLDCEIISLDSMSIYRGMDIGTAKPTPQQQQQVPHHLIDIRQPTEDFSVSQFCDAAIDKIDEIRQRDRQILFVGGTPLYLKSLLRGLFKGPAADWDFRNEVEQEIQQVGLGALRERLLQVDPVSAAKLHPHDQRRMIRALEVYRVTGKPISHLQVEFERGLPASQCKVFVLHWPRERLHQRIESRVDAMFKQGLVDEVERLLSQHQQLSHTASQAVGYREVIEHLEGQRRLDETVEAVKARTRQFARRQETWFRGLSECRWLTLAPTSEPGKIATQILTEGQDTP